MTPYLRAANVMDGELDLSDVKRMNFEPVEQARFALRGGDVLVTEGSGSVSAVGASSVWNAELPGVVCFQNTLLRLRPRSSTDPRFLAWWCRRAFADGVFASVSTGANIFHVSAERLRSIPMSFVPLDEQRAIADYLDTETARIDFLITKKRRMIALLNERWRTAVEGRIGSLMRQHGGIPLKRVVHCLDRARVPLSAEERASRGGPYPYYGASGAIDSIDNYLYDEELVLLGEDGAQLADPDYEISFVVSGKVWVNNHAHVLRPTRSDAHLLAMHLSTLDRGAFISGATREKITQEDMNDIPVPHMPIASQRLEAQTLMLVRGVCDEAAEALRRQIGLLVEHRQALITAAVTGELRVPGAAA